MKTCKNCKCEFNPKVLMNGIMRNGNARKLCYTCSPFGNTKYSMAGGYNNLTGTEASKRSKSRGRRYSKKIRLLAILKLGAKCSRCEINDIRILQFDHKNNDGAEDRRYNSTKYNTNGFNLHRDIIEERRDDIQLLCANCHALKTWETFSKKDDILGYIL